MIRHDAHEEAPQVTDDEATLADPAAEETQGAGDPGRSHAGRFVPRKRPSFVDACEGDGGKKSARDSSRARPEGPEELMLLRTV